MPGRKASSGASRPFWRRSGACPSLVNKVPLSPEGVKPPCWSHPFQAPWLTIAPPSPARPPAPGKGSNPPQNAQIPDETSRSTRRQI